MGLLGWLKGMLSGDDGGVIHNESDDSNIVAHRTSKASKAYVCDTCGNDIGRREIYARLTRRIEGRLVTGKHCLKCRPLERVP